MPRKKGNRNVVARWQKYLGKGDLQDWQRLMSDLGFEEDFPSKRQCRLALNKVWVNIPDFLDAMDSGTPVHFFPSQRALANYTFENGRFFPKRRIESGSPLAALKARIL